MGNTLLLIAVVCIGVGAYQLRSMTWETATASVDKCVSTTRYANNHGTNHKTAFPHQSCAAAWSAGGVSHTAQVEFDVDHSIDGATRQIMIHGGTAMAPEKNKSGFLLVGGGLLALILGLVARITAGRDN
jgi:hypothetical protein